MQADRSTPRRSEIRPRHLELSGALRLRELQILQLFLRRSVRGMLLHVDLKNTYRCVPFSALGQSCCQEPLNNGGLPVAQFQCAVGLFDGFVWRTLAQVRIRVDRVSSPGVWLGSNRSAQIRQGLAGLVFVLQSVAQGTH